MTIRNKILMTSSVSLLLLVVIGVVSYRSINKLTALGNTTAQTYARQVLLKELLSNLKDAETGQRGYLLTGDLTYLEPYLAGSRDAQLHLAQIRTLYSDPSNAPKLDLLERAAAGKLAELKQTVDLRREKGFDAALTVVKSNLGKNLMDDIRSVVKALADQDQAALKASEADAAKATDATQITIIVVTAAAFIIVFLLSTFVLRAISVPLSNFMELVEKVGKGDLTVKANAEGRDEFARLGNSLNVMLTGLRHLTEQTRTATTNLNSATAEILASTQEQAAGTGEQAAAVQQTTVTMDEIRQSGLQIAERARQVAATAQETATSTNAGLQAVENTGRSMENIREQAEAVAENIVRLSERTQVVGEIIATVNDIAEQSHLLALNAAIEAAAAGEHGRSFAVIASEIKNLADQSKEATVQVRSILGEIQRGINSSVMLTEEAVKRIEAGKRHSETADGTIRRMAESIQQSVQAFQQIVAGSNQQHIGFEQVLQAIRNIGQASHQTASATRQLEKAAANLNALGQQLKNVGDAYQI